MGSGVRSTVFILFMFGDRPRCEYRCIERGFFFFGIVTSQSVRCQRCALVFVRNVKRFRVQHKRLIA